MNQPYKPLISVNITCYNYEEYIGQAIDSVLAQTYDNYELIVIDNASTDGSRRVIQSYGDRLTCIVLDENDGQRAYEAFLKEAKGEYIAMLCADDCWYPEKLEKQVQAIAEHPECNVFFTLTEYTDAELKRIEGNRFFQENRNQGQWLRLFIEEGTVLDGSSLVHKLDSQYTKNGDMVGCFRRVPDLAAYYYIIQHENIYVVQECLTKHRIHGKNVSTPSRENNAMAYSEVAFLVHDAWEKMSPKIFREAYPEWFEDSIEATEVDIICCKILQYLKIAYKKEYLRDGALRYLWAHYNAEVSERLQSEYDFDKEKLWELIHSYGQGKWVVMERELAMEEELRNNAISCLQKILSHLEDTQLRMEVLPVMGQVLNMLLKSFDMKREQLIQQACLCYNCFQNLTNDSASESNWGIFIETSKELLQTVEEEKTH